MGVHLKGHRNGFSPGVTAITGLEDEPDPTGIALAVHKLAAGEVIEETTVGETAWLLMTGEIDVQTGGSEAHFARGSIFDELPSCVHVGAGTPVRIRSVGDSELTVYRTANRHSFPTCIYRPQDVRDEHRGKGQVHDTCYRFVRTIFDRTNAPAAAELVLGEVITMPGRWSSYPPHHHPQPEIYHYRFTAPEGFGYAALGDDVLAVRHNDTVKILDGVDHPQAAAPGYGMYYAWVIRHLPDAPYDVPEFTPEHRWIMDADADGWWPDGIE